MDAIVMPYRLNADYRLVITKRENWWEARILRLIKDSMSKYDWTTITKLIDRDEINLIFRAYEKIGTHIEKWEKYYANK